MIQKKTFKYIWSFIIAIQMFVGRFYDERFCFFDINFSIIISVIFLLFMLIGYTLYEKTPLDFNLQIYLIFAFLLVLIALFFFFINNFSNEYGLKKFLEFIFITSLLVIIILYSKDIELLKYIIISMFLLATFLFISAYILSLKNKFVFDGERLALFGGGPIVFARWIIMAMLCFIYVIKTRMLYKILYVIFGTILVLFSGSKGPLLAFLVSVSLTYAISNIQSKRFIYSIILLMVGFTITFFSVSYLNSVVLLPERIHQLTDPDKLVVTASVTDREEMYPASYEIFLQHPLGIGLGNWAYYHNNNHVKLNLNDYPHNVFLEILNESGIFVFILFVIIIIMTFCKSYVFYKNYHKSEYCKSKNENLKLINFFFSFFLFTFINSNISGDLSNNRHLFFAIASLLVITSSFKKNVITQQKRINNIC